MAATTHTGALDTLIREILSSAASDSRKLAPGRVQKQFRSAASQDYARQLRELFDRREMRELFADFRSALPALNADIFRIQEPRRLAGVAAELGARFRASRFEGQEGKSDVFPECVWRIADLCRKSVIRHTLVPIRATLHQSALPASR